MNHKRLARWSKLVPWVDFWGVQGDGGISSTNPGAEGLAPQLMQGHQPRVVDHSNELGWRNLYNELHRM